MLHVTHRLNVQSIELSISKQPYSKVLNSKIPTHKLFEDLIPETVCAVESCSDYLHTDCHLVWCSVQHSTHSKALGPILSRRSQDSLFQHRPNTPTANESRRIPQFPQEEGAKNKNQWDPSNSIHPNAVVWTNLPHIAFPICLAP